MTTRSLLVVGIGNPSRGDDGIGRAVVDAVRAEPDLADVETVLAVGDLTDLIVIWGPNHDVVIVDAMVGGGPPGSIVTIDGLNEPLPEAGRPLSSHGFGLVETLALAHLLNRLPRSLTILAVELGDTTSMAPLTDPVRAAVPDVVGRIGTLAAGRARSPIVDKGGQSDEC